MHPFAEGAAIVDEHNALAIDAFHTEAAFNFAFHVDQDLRQLLYGELLIRGGTRVVPADGLAHFLAHLLDEALG